MRTFTSPRMRSPLFLPLGKSEHRYRTIGKDGAQETGERAQRRKRHAGLLEDSRETTKSDQNQWTKVQAATVPQDQQVLYPVKEVGGGGLYSRKAEWQGPQCNGPQSCCGSVIPCFVWNNSHCKGSSKVCGQSRRKGHSQSLPHRKISHLQCQNLVPTSSVPYCCAPPGDRQAQTVGINLFSTEGS